MLFPTPSSAASSLLVFFLPSFATAISLTCSDIRDDGVGFDLKPLGGPHSIYQIIDLDNTYKNTTFTIDICQPLIRDSKNIPKAEDCPGGSRVCGIERTTNLVEDATLITDTWPIAGEYTTSIGGSLDPHVKRLKGSESTSDREKEGVRITMNGGKHGKQKQKAIVEFICLREEARVSVEEDGDSGKNKGHDDSGEEQPDGHDGSLKLVSWEAEGDDKVLRLEWKTKYACEDADGSDRGDSNSGHWGFFTWLIIILFMGVAAYLIFGSWLNYNRYSARGWDVLPHSDMIQDLPYLFRDWMRRVINTIQGGGSRGGYSAV